MSLTYNILNANLDAFPLRADHEGFTHQVIAGTLMPIHDWKRVDAGIHAFHHEWISTLARVLNDGLLPDEYYALPEQFAPRLNPVVLTLRTITANEPDGESAASVEHRGPATSVACPALETSPS